MFRIAALLALFVSCGVASPLDRELRDFTSLRLPNTTIPTHYDLYLDTDVHLGIFEYYGNVRISITVLVDTHQIVLHSVRSVIERLQLFRDQLEVPLHGFELDEDTQFLIVNSVVLLSAGAKYVLDIDFTNNLDRDDKGGFYLSSYETETGEPRYLGVTQFEPCDARTAFPCYDEPAIKTTYDIQIECGTEYNAHANSPILGVQILPKRGKKLTTFQTTPRMQSYIVAFLVSDYIAERQIVKEPRQVAVATLARPTARNLLSYSVDASVRFLRELEIYFDQEYAMSKMDNVAVNNDDFWPGAMENWGLVTYRESAILFDPDTQTESDQVGIVSIVAHEYVHQFFGNLLAPQWWSMVWLNEGFANLYQFYIADISHPETNMRDRFGGVREGALNGDGSATIRPMTHYVERPEEIRTLFDGIAYSKSASVLHMFSNAFTEQTFQKGLRYYIKQNKDVGVVGDQDLFDSLQQAAFEDARLPLGLTVNEVFSTWSDQPGAPVVSVKRIGDTNEYTFTQERLYNEPQDNPSSQSWWIPISYSSTSNSEYDTKAAFWMPPSTSEVSYHIEGESVLINPLATGYYRVNYDEQMWANIIYELYENTNTIPRLSRSQLIDDSLHLAYAGKLDYYTAFKVIDYLQDEIEYIPWATAASNFDYLHRMLRHDKKALANLESYVAQLASKLLITHGLNPVKGESANIEDVRSIGLKWACKYDQQCKTEAATRIGQIRQRSSFSIATKSEQLLLCDALRFFNYGDYATLTQSLRTTQDQRIRKHMIAAITCIESETVVNDLLSSLRSADYQLAEKLQIIQAISQNSQRGLDAVIELLAGQIDIVNELRLNRRDLGPLLKNIAEYTVEPAAAAKLTAIVARETPTLLAAVRTKLAENQSWVRRNAAIVSSMLESPAQVNM